MMRDTGLHDEDPQLWRGWDTAHATAARNTEALAKKHTCYGVLNLWSKSVTSDTKQCSIAIHAPRVGTSSSQTSYTRAEALIMLLYTRNGLRRSGTEGEH